MSESYPPYPVNGWHNSNSPEYSGWKRPMEFTETEAAVEAAAVALYEARYEHRDWAEAKSPDTWREYARLALAAALPHVEVYSDGNEFFYLEPKK